MDSLTITSNDDLNLDELYSNKIDDFTYGYGD
jgi:hypothetical protein